MALLVAIFVTPPRACVWVQLKLEDSYDHSSIVPPTVGFYSRVASISLQHFFPSCFLFKGTSVSLKHCSTAISIRGDLFDSNIVPLWLLFHCGFYSTVASIQGWPCILRKYGTCPCGDITPADGGRSPVYLGITDARKLVYKYMYMV